MFSPVLVGIHLYAGERKGDFDWALVSCAAAGQKTGSHWTQVAVFLGGGCADPLCRGFSAIGPSHRVDGRESRLEGYTADTQRVQGANRSSLSPPLPRPNHSLNHAIRTV